ncbi:Hpt domain-containing protein [Maribacter sp. 2304DJ31-5]|uniref:Hpt domain-containing protein n=1 Tax=Maribacter sp. 2304DJ31-5 TaxID=3386273 RepID=UPI0039BD5BC6
MKEQPNLNYVKKLAGDDIDFENEFIALIKEEFPIERNTYLDHIEGEQLREASEIVHKLKHKFNILGMEGAYRFAVLYEERLCTGNIEMDMDFRTILKTIETYLKTI